MNELVDLNNSVHKRMIESGMKRLEDSTNNSRGKTQLNKDDFLKILMAEVQNQDPFNPKKGQEYGAELAQFSQLEQMVNMNTNLKKIDTNQGVVNKNDLVNYIGKDVYARKDTIDFESGKSASISFNVSKDVEMADVEVYDFENKLVRTIKVGAHPAGLVEVKWDGVDDSGTMRHDGEYNIKVKAKNVFGVNVPADTYIRGRVTGVSYENNKPVVLIGQHSIEPEKIQKIFAAGVRR